MIGEKVIDDVVAGVRSRPRVAAATLIAMIALMAIVTATCAATRGDDTAAGSGRKAGESVARSAELVRQELLEAERKAAEKAKAEKAAKAAKAALEKKKADAAKAAAAAKLTTTTKVPLSVPATQPGSNPVVTTPEEANLGDIVDLGEKLGTAVGDTGPEAWPGGCCAALTGLGYDSGSFASRPALAMKVSNSPSADPQTSLYRSDLIYEIKVEGFSRLIAVFQSRSVGDIGPLRSGRTSDPPILHGLGQPLVGNSGGNPTVLARFDEAAANGWLVNLPRGGDPFYRSADRVAPHNFYAISSALWAYGGGQPPRPQFDFLTAGQSNPSAVPVSSVSTEINRVSSSFTWDPGSRFFLRSQYGRPHTDKVTGHRIARTSVVVLKTSYGVSGADARSPEAISTWTGGRGMGLHGGHVRPR